MPSFAPNMSRTIDKSFFCHISWRAMMREKSLLMYWADKGRNATSISGKMESTSDLQIFPIPGDEVDVGAEERRRHFRTV
jgi:hypothetical protein